MNDIVTVDEAIQKGHRIITYPTIIIIIGVFALCFYLIIQVSMTFWIIPIGFVLAVGFAWLYWSITITKWRLWAFKNVNNVHELKRRAIQEKLIWPEDSIFEKTEIRKPSDKENWNSLQSKFNQEDTFHDDYTIPNETLIYYSKVKNFIEMAVMLGCLVFGIYLLAVTDNYIIGFGFSLFGAYFSYKEFKEATNVEPQIIINEKGIQTISTQFYNWVDIENEVVISEGSSRHINYYLTYDHPGGREKLKIDDYKTDLNTLNKLLTLYRGRYKKKHNYR